VFGGFRGLIQQSYQVADLRFLAQGCQRFGQTAGYLTERFHRPADSVAFPQHGQDLLLWQIGHESSHDVRQRGGRLTRRDAQRDLEGEDPGFAGFDRLVDEPPQADSAEQGRDRGSSLAIASIIA